MLNRFLFSIALLFFLVFAWYFQSIQPVANTDVPLVDFEIKTGSSLDKITEDLSSKKLIRSRTGFKLTVMRLGIANKIQAGFFEISPHDDATSIAESLTHAQVKQIRVTVPEGLRKEEISLIFEKAFSKSSGSKFSTKEFLSLTSKKEGQLFPDTYDFNPDATALDIVGRLISKFESTIKELQITEQKLSSVTILASLLEREAASSSEMPEIAGILIKRAESNWPLQVDATVQYALGTKNCHQNDCDWWKKSLTLLDLQTVSPYNTYLNKGFPPSPISNPGKAALSAAYNPKTTTSWFYLHDLQGKIHFADTIEKHNQNVCLYLKKDCK